MSKKLKIPIFFDCGAPSLYNKLSRKDNTKGVMGATFSERKYDDFSYVRTPEYKKYLQDYIDFLRVEKDYIDTYSNLDVINNERLTAKNQLILRKNGLEPIPVFHLGEPIEILRKMVNESSYIAIGGLIPNPTNVLLPILDRLFKDIICDEFGFPKVKVHGFACTSPVLMTRYPWYSVDSATVRKIANYGNILLSDYKSKSLTTYSISERRGNAEYLLTPLIKKHVEALGFSIEALQKEPVERMAITYMSLLKIADTIPNYPWSFTTGKSKETASERLLVYLAGVLSKKEESLLWSRMTSLRKDRSSLGRLLSFFYHGKGFDYFKNLYK